jgi:hypothetical protein
VSPFHPDIFFLSLPSSLPPSSRLYAVRRLLLHPPCRTPANSTPLTRPIQFA